MRWKKKKSKTCSKVGVGFVATTEAFVGCIWKIWACGAAGRGSSIVTGCGLCSGSIADGALTPTRTRSGNTTVMMINANIAMVRPTNPTHQSVNVELLQDQII